SGQENMPKNPMQENRPESNAGQPVDIPVEEIVSIHCLHRSTTSGKRRCLVGGSKEYPSPVQLPARSHTRDRDVARPQSWQQCFGPSKNAGPGVSLRGLWSLKIIWRKDPDFGSCRRLLLRLYAKLLCKKAIFARQ